MIYTVLRDFQSWEEEHSKYVGKQYEWGRERRYAILTHEKSTRNIKFYIDFSSPVKPADYIIEKSFRAVKCIKEDITIAKSRVPGLVAFKYLFYSISDPKVLL